MKYSSGNKPLPTYGGFEEPAQRSRSLTRLAEQRPLTFLGSNNILSFLELTGLFFIINENKKISTITAAPRGYHLLHHTETIT